jgi:hypothetical protein
MSIGSLFTWSHANCIDYHGLSNRSTHSSRGLLSTQLDSHRLLVVLVGCCGSRTPVLSRGSKNPLLWYQHHRTRTLRCFGALFFLIYYLLWLLLHHSCKLNCLDRVYIASSQSTLRSPSYSFLRGHRSFHGHLQVVPPTGPCSIVGPLPLVCSGMPLCRSTIIVWCLLASVLFVVLPTGLSWPHCRSFGSSAGSPLLQACCLPPG